MRDLSVAEYDWNDESTMTFEAASLVDRHSAVEGTFRSQRDLRVEGDVKGTISCDGTLFIAEGASISASVDAEHINVAGDLSGEVRCRGRLQILPSGRVKAKVSTAALVIQEGAVYEGQLEMAGIERSAPRPLRSRASTGPVSIDAAPNERPSGDRQSGSGTTFIRRLGSPEAPWESDGEPPIGGEVPESPEGEGPAS
jgi:cytoskeletal protein CcmA (bactofilin family)